MSDIAGVEDERDWVMMTHEELAPIIRGAIGGLGSRPDCRCQKTWAESDERLPDWYQAIR